MGDGEWLDSVRASLNSYAHALQRWAVARGVMERVVYCPGLPAGRRWVPLDAYVTGVKLAKASPEAEFRHGLTAWWPISGAEIVRELAL